MHPTMLCHSRLVCAIAACCCHCCCNLPLLSCFFLVTNRLIVMALEWLQSHTFGSSSVIGHEFHFVVQATTNSPALNTTPTTTPAYLHDGYCFHRNKVFYSLDKLNWSPTVYFLIPCWSCARFSAESTIVMPSKAGFLSPTQIWSASYALSQSKL